MSRHSYARARRFVAIAVAVLSFSTAAAAQSMSVVLTSVKDNTLYQDAGGTLSNGAGTGFFAGVNGQGLIRRGLMRFDVAGAVPVGATILTASLQLNCSNAGGSATAVDLLRVLADWGEAGSIAGGSQGSGAAALPGDATWIHTSFNTSFWASAGGDFTALSSASTSVNLVGLYTWGSTTATVADVQSWLDSPSSNFGWMIKTPETVAGNNKRFDTRELANSTLRPKLTVTYLPPVQASVQSFGAGCGGPAMGVQLMAVGLPVLGNAGFALSITDASPMVDAYVFLASGIANQPFVLSPGCLVHLDLPSAASAVSAGVSPFGPLSTGMAGSALLPVPLPASAALAGFTVATQCLLPDPATMSGFAVSNALTLVLGY